MFKRIVVALVCAVFFCVQANASTQNGLPELFSELNYELTVNWDQKDQDFYQKQVQKFSQSVKELQAKGLTNQQLMDYTISQLKDESLAKDMRTAFTMVKINQMSATEAQEYVKDLMNKHYSRGASWTGGAAEAIIAVAFLAAIVYASIYIYDHTCVSRCEKDCYGFGAFCYEDCQSRCN